MQIDPVVLSNWSEVLDKMERAVENWLPSLRETSPESASFSIPPARPIPTPNLAGLEGATKHAEDLVGQVDADANATAEQLGRWLTEHEAVRRKLAENLERAIG